jgi:uncharacterized protein YhfF
MRDRLVAAVIRGEKTATTSLLAEWEADSEPLPSAGDRLTVIDSDEKPVAVIELTAVEVLRLGEVELELAKDEGEGFKTVGEWRRQHERFWDEENARRVSDPLTDDTRIVVERFRLAEFS